MKKNSVIIILILIIVGLISFIVYDKVIKNKINYHDELEEATKLVDYINLDYLDIYLFSDGTSYLAPLNKERINNLNAGNNLKDRLTTLYDRSFYYDLFIDGKKLRGFRIKLDEKIEKIRKIEEDNNTYIIFIKENNTIGFFDYLEYCDNLFTDVLDNYQNVKNVKDVEDNKIVYLDGSKEEIKGIIN